MSAEARPDLRSQIKAIINETVQLRSSGAPCGGWTFVGLDKAADAILDTVRASLALTGITDDLVALGVAGIQARDAQGWSGEEDEDQINHELTRAVLAGILGRGQ